MKLDLLAFGAHPDDIELSCSGTLTKMAAQGYLVGGCDLTRGELGTRGSADLRDQEAQDAAQILGLAVRENLRLPDGGLQNVREQQVEVIKMIRKYRPEIVFANAVRDRHPDHGNGSALVRDAAFLAGLRKISTQLDGVEQAAWRPAKVFFYIQDQLMIPDFVVDITDHFETKIASIKAYKSQFFDPNSKEPMTYISSQDYWDFISARNRETGHLVNVTFGEGFQSERPLKITDVMQLG
ncbi:MAG: bacillithiol biosynthesis deacetylase BshB1 [Bacteroidia bacterium]|nr:bacillithiol biosynthesis deacetylase BshB1 [Bacteroidia bacterium]